MPERHLSRFTRARMLGVGLAVVAAMTWSWTLSPSAADFLSRAYFYPMRALHGLPSDEGVTFVRSQTKTADGSPLDTWTFPPSQPGLAPRALVVQAHGNAANLSYQWRLASGLTHSGYEVVAFDYRGFGDSPGRASRRHAVEDLRAVLDAESTRAKDLGVPLLVLGQSMGAAVSVEALAGRRDVAAVALDSPFASWTRIGWYHAGRGRPLSYLVRGLLAAGFASAPPEPADLVTRMSDVPLLIVGGGADRVCPADEARALAQAAGPRASLLIVPDAPHVGTRTDLQDAVVMAHVRQLFDAATAPR